MDNDVFEDRLLVVDDDPAFGRLVKRIAEPLGFETITISDSRELLKIVQTWRPGVVLVDLQMPGADGVEVLRDLAADKCLATVFVTSGLDGRTIDTAVRLGTERGLKMGGTLPKPIGAAELGDVLAALQPIERLLTLSDFSKAIAGDQLFLEYQPKFDCRGGRAIGAEALVRWQHPVHGLVRPDQFIPAMEETDAIDQLTDWVVATAARQAATWATEGLDLAVAVNISARNLQDCQLPDRLSQLCREAGIFPEAVTLELTETGAMRSAIQMMDVLTRLRIKGFSLSLDDFGTGYSSLIQLRKMPFSEIKVDRSFVMHMNHDQDSDIIVEITIDLARKLGLKSVAEGVEDGAALNRLIALGCDTVQGYHLSRPIAADRIPPFIRQCEDAMSSPDHWTRSAA